MVWFKVDDQIAVHVKAVAAGNTAMGLWVRAGSWCAAQLTDGFVPDAMVPALGGSVKDAQRLVDVGLWHLADGGWSFHDWAEYQPTREQVLAEREAAAERMRNVRANRKGNVQANMHRTFAGGSASPSPSPSPDLTKTSQRQSSNDRGSVSTDSNEPSPMTKRLAAQAGITSLAAVVESVAKHTGRAIGFDAAFQLSTHLLGKAKTHPRAPQRYVTGAVSRSPFEVQQWLDEHGLGVAS